MSAAGKADITVTIRRVVEILSNVHTVFTTGAIEERRKVVAAIFPEKIIFDGFGFRTERLNEAVSLIFNVGAGFRDLDFENFSSPRKKSSSDRSNVSKIGEKGDFFERKFSNRK